MDANGIDAECLAQSVAQPRTRRVELRLSPRTSKRNSAKRDAGGAYREFKMLSRDYGDLARNALARFICLACCRACEEKFAIAQTIVAGLSRDDPVSGASAPLSVPWTQQRTSGTVNKNGSGAGIGSVDGLGLFAYWSANPVSNDQYSQVRIVGGLSNNTQFVGVVVRASGNTDGTYTGYAFYSDGLGAEGQVLRRRGELFRRAGDDAC